MDEPLGKVFAHYRIVERIGAGGMGVVYRARDEHLERDVAVKILPSAAAVGDDARRRFRREALSLSRLSHPNVATVHDFDTSEGVDFLVMEHIPGETLDVALRRGPLAEAEVIRIAEQTARGLAAAHEQGILHGDLKPGNLMVTPSGLVKILDFGLARWLRAHDRQETASAPLGRSIEGTLPYMAPEQIRSLEIDARVDIYALGVVIYEMLTGRHPFHGSGPVQLLQAILDSPLKPPGSIVTGVCPGLEALCLRAMERDRDRRYARADEVIEALVANRSGTVASGQDRPSTAPDHESLPIPLSSFIGRDTMIAEGLELLSRARLLTLTGPGGTGKSRTALELAARSRSRFRDGAAFIPLAPIREVPLVSCAVAQAMGIREVPGQPMEETLKAHLRTKETLLLIDNFEQVIGAAPLVSGLLAACPGVKALVTSRCPLRLRGERELPIPPLELPGEGSLEDLPRSESIRLFAERAGEVKASFRVGPENIRDVAQICRRLDGLPLAIELAAAWVKVLTPAKILEKLESRFELLTGGARDLPARHQSMRETITWSHDLLDERGRRTWRLLSVFRGGCTVASARVVLGAAGAPGSSGDVAALEAIADLVDKSILVECAGKDGEPRFRMLEVIREFGLDRLLESGEDTAARGAHLEHFASFAKLAEGELSGKNQVRTLVGVDEEHDNFRAALEWSLASGGARETELGLELAGALWYYWLIRGRLSEGRERLRRMLAAPAGRSATRARAKALFGEGTLAHNLGDCERARSLYEDSLAIARQLGDEPWTASSLHRIGWVDQLLGDLEEGRRKSEESLALFRKVGDRRGTMYPLRNLGWIANSRGEYATAEQCFEEALRASREAGDSRGIGFCLTYLAWVYIHRGRLDRALELLEEAVLANKGPGDVQIEAFSMDLRALALHAKGDHEQAARLLEAAALEFRGIEDRFGLMFTLVALGRARLCLGDAIGARTALTEALAISNALGQPWSIAASRQGLAEIEAAAGDRERAAELVASSLELRVRLEDRKGVIECLESMAGLLLDTGNAREAAELLGSASALRASIGAPATHPEREVEAVRRSRLEALLGPRELLRALEGGRLLDWKAASARALELGPSHIRGSGRPDAARDR